MAEITKDDVISYIENMSVLDLSNMIKELEEKFGVSAAAVAAAPAAVAAGGDAAAAEEKTEFDIVLVGAGEKRINVIKVVREVTGLGLKEAKDFVDALPKAVKEAIPKAEAEDIKKKLEEAGASAEIK
ncbi:MAG: 50S ribosomal protein L7/L12 [Deltaproteobacteria bacterium]|nr:MAG: 50S ribosomal protein L7/L12 [Deltaproteobacteria bacterium]